MGKRRPRDIETAELRAIYLWLRDNGYPEADKRTLHGQRDEGDLTGIPGIMWEHKGGAQGRDASDQQIGKWMATEVSPQIGHARADYGFLSTPRRGIGPANAHLWWTHWYLGDFMRLVGAGSVAQRSLPNRHAIIRLPIFHTVQLLRAAGYGEPL